MPRSGIRLRAAELVRVRDELERTYAARDGSEEADRAWGLAAETFREATRAFYAPFTNLGRAIRAGDPMPSTQPSVPRGRPLVFRSGYVKAELMSALANAPLRDEENDATRPSCSTA